MAGNLFIPEAVNLYATDTGPDNSKHLQIMGITLPDMEQQTQEHRAGGAIGAIEIGGLGLNALSCNFKVAGYDPQLMSRFGLGLNATEPYTIYGVIRDKVDGTKKELRAVLRGIMAKLTKGEMKRGDLSDQDHTIKEIIHYELYFDKKEIYFYDWASNVWRVNGNDQFASDNAILRI